MLKTIAIVIIAIIAAVLVFAATRSDTFRVFRTTRIQAPPERIFPLINDLHRFNTWNPYERKDPNLKGRYSGATAGKGAMYSFDGNHNVGQGTVEITDSVAPLKVAMQLHMIKPFEARNQVEFTLEPRGPVTEVTWAMSGHRPYLGKLIGLFFDTDRMIGPDFEAGLASLKAAVEK
jgi:uncharacterized protein YndB with AHSA1/START domain